MLEDIVNGVKLDRLLIVVDRLDEMIGSLGAFIEPLSELISKR